MAFKRIAETTNDKKIYGLLQADSKAEVTDNLVFDDGYKMDFGSFAITGDGELAMLKSDGTWGWF